MFKKVLPSALTLALALMGLGASAQNVASGSERGRNWCGSVAEQERYFAEHPGAREKQLAWYRQMATTGAAQQRGTAGVPDVTIPVVVHVIHSGGANNISDQQIASAIDQLNTDYQKLNGDTANTVAQFRPIAASLGFQFRLAKRDPNGNCTTGITRHYAPNLINDNQSGAVQAVAIWDRDRYLNIWVVGSIGTPSAGGIILGYSNLPQNSTPQRDGFVVRNDWFGNQGTSNPSRAQDRTATHEIGHYMGLLHPWGQTNNPGTGDCTGSDFVADTPPTDGTFNCDLSYAPCGTLANVQNFMDYASCPTMFTLGQKALMRNVLSTFRNGLSTPANLIATGTNDGFVAPSCAPIAAFAATSNTNVCVNSAVTLQDFSYNTDAAGGRVTYSWSFPGGTPATATGATVSVSYATAGFYPVTETVTNRIGSGTTTINSYIRVEGPTGGETAPFAESFEDSSFPTIFAAPSLRNYETSGTTSAGVASGSFVWRRQAAFPAATGSAYLVVNNRTYPAGTTTTLITPNINLASAPSGSVLRFARAYALRTANSNDQLRISFSSDCGISWSAPTVLNTVNLTTQGLTPIDGYVPTASTDWQDLTVPIPAQYQGSGLFKVRLQMLNGTPQGNNFYLDNLRVSSPLATRADALANRGISVYPNPVTNTTAVHVTLAAATTIELRLTDLLGRDVLSLPAKTYGVGQQTLPLLAAGRTLPAGIYVVRISLDGETYSSKLTVE